MEIKKAFADLSDKLNMLLAIMQKAYPEAAELLEHRGGGGGNRDKSLLL